MHFYFLLSPIKQVGPPFLPDLSPVRTESVPPSPSRCHAHFSSLAESMILLKNKEPRLFNWGKGQERSRNDFRWLSRTAKGASLLAHPFPVQNRPTAIQREKGGERGCLRSHVSLPPHSCQTERRRTDWVMSRGAKLNCGQETQTRASFPEETHKTLSVRRIEPSAF